MRGLESRIFALVLVAFSACGKVPLRADGGDDGSIGAVCTANARSCGNDDALYECNESGDANTKIQDCQYGCTDDHCNECDANTTFCNSDDLVMCSAAGEIVNPQTCAHGCQMDRCNTCTPGVAYCDNANAVVCAADGTPGTTANCGSAGCISGVCNSCQPNTTTCQGDTLVVCNANGNVRARRRARSAAARRRTHTARRSSHRTASRHQLALFQIWSCRAPQHST